MLALILRGMDFDCLTREENPTFSHKMPPKDSKHVLQRSYFNNVYATVDSFKLVKRRSLRW